jgi:hypothetical protein
MKASTSFLLAAAIAFTGCASEATDPPGGDGSGSGSGSDQEGETVMPGPEASPCDDGTDVVCGDASCTADPDCASEPVTPGCTPNPLPPAPSNMTSSTTLFAPRKVAAANGKVYIGAYATQWTSSGKIFTCTADSCASTPPSFGAGFDPEKSIFAPLDGAVVWSTNGGSIDPSQILRGNADGSAPQVLLTTSIANHATISGNAGIYEDYAVFTDVSDPGTPNAGLRAITSTLVSPPVPGISAPIYSVTYATAGDNYIAYYANPVTSPAAPYDRKIHIYDFDGNQVGVTAATASYMRHMEISGDTLLYMTDGGFFACSLPACSSPKNVGMQLNTRGFTFAVKDGRVYFTSVRDRGCNLGLDGVLASCATEEVLAGTCTPEVHSTSFHYVNAYSLAIDGTNSYFTTKTAIGVFKAAL